MHHMDGCRCYFHALYANYIEIEKSHAMDKRRRQRQFPSPDFIVEKNFQSRNRINQKTITEICTKNLTPLNFRCEQIMRTKFETKGRTEVIVKTFGEVQN